MFELPLELRMRTGRSPDYQLFNRAGSCVGDVTRDESTQSRSTWLVRDAGGALQATIVADERLMSSGLRFDFLDAGGRLLGRVESKSLLSSIWGRMQADVHGPSVGTARFVFTEDSLLRRWVRLVMEHIAWLDLAKSWIINPTFTMRRPSGAIVARLRKLGTFLEGDFRMEGVGRLASADSQLVALSLLALSLVATSREN